MTHSKFILGAPRLQGRDPGVQGLEQGAEVLCVLWLCDAIAL
jgi:hypothetical protein